MNNAEFEKVVESTFLETRDLLVVKGAEYADHVDRLANFKRGASLTGLTPLQVCFIYASKHYDAIASYVREPNRPSSEPIEGRFNDLINYCLLAKALVREGGGNILRPIEKTLYDDRKGPNYDDRKFATTPF